MNKSSNSFFRNIIKPFYFNSNKESQAEDWEKITSHEQKVFAFETLASATRNFHPDNKLGQVGFGPVFKGKLESGEEIGVKKLAQTSNQGKRASEHCELIRLLCVPREALGMNM